MHKFNELSSPPTYGEVSQVNPLRWEMLYKEEDGSFSVQTAKIRCKDFFNDVVPRFHGKEGCSIYGFSSTAEKLKLNEEGLYVRLTSIQAPKVLEKNLTKLVPPEFYEYETINDTTALLLMKKELFDNTYFVSLFTLLVRLSCYKEEFNSLAEVFESKSYQADGCVGGDRGKKLVLEWEWNVPKEYSKYFFYASKDYNSTKKYIASYLHNCGIGGWGYAVQQDVEYAL